MALPARWWTLFAVLQLLGCRDDATRGVDAQAPFDGGPLSDLSSSTQQDLASHPSDDLSMPPSSSALILKGVVVAPAGPFLGEVLVVGSKIECAQASCESEPLAQGATVLDTHGFIYPGLVDAHNHGIFNLFDGTDWAPTKLYHNHNQWTAEVRYQQMIDAKHYLAGELNSPVDYRCEMDKYAEVKALVSGTTSMVVAPGTALGCFSSVIRTIDTPESGLAKDNIQTSISVPAAASAQSVCNNFASGKTGAYVIHIAEGIDSTALNEFATLSGRASGCLLAPETTIVHGTALGLPEFTTMQAHDMKLVWSPRSNMFLYGDTTKINLALQAGVTIALAPDWSMGGSVNLLEELRFAHSTDVSKFGGILSNQMLFEMVTINAAKALASDSEIGSIEVGKRADLMVLSGDQSKDAYDALLSAVPANVSLVFVDGQARYGDLAWMSYGPSSPGCETISICGADKFVCVAESASSNKLNQTFADITSTLDSAISAYDGLSGISPGFAPIAPIVECQ